MSGDGWWKQPVGSVDLTQEAREGMDGRVDGGLDYYWRRASPFFIQSNLNQERPLSRPRRLFLMGTYDHQNSADGTHMCLVGLRARLVWASRVGQSRARTLGGLAGGSSYRRRGWIDAAIEGEACVYGLIVSHG